MDTYFAKRAYAGGRGSAVFLKKDEKLKHHFILGKSGTGKSSLIKTLLLDDIYQGRSCMLIDPHGDLAEDLLFHIPRDRVRDVVYFDPANRENPATINLLEKPEHPHQRSLVADNIISIFHGHWGDSWGPRLEQILRHCLIALLDYDEETTILGIGRLLTDESYRRRVVSRIQNPVTKAYWIDQFDRYNPRFRIEAITPVLTRLEKLTSNPTIRNILGVPKSTVNIRKIIDENKILIVNLNQGAIGKSYSDLLGSILLGLTERVVYDRSSVPEEERGPFMIYVDEISGMSDGILRSMIGQVRKFGCGLTLATQSLADYSDEMKTTLMNCGTITSFRVAGRDARYLHEEFDMEVSQESFTALEPNQAYIKMSDGSLPFRVFVDRPPSYYRRGRRRQVIRASEAQYTRPLDTIERKINRWMNSQFL